MPLTRQQKVELADEYKSILDKTAGFIVFDYRGLTVEEVNDLRGKLRDAGANMQVVKNRMLKRAVEDRPYADQLNDLLIGTNAAIFANEEDPITPAKAIVNFAKDNEKIHIKAGVIGTDFMDDKGVGELAKVPSQEELYAKILGGIKSPAQNVLGGIKGLHQKLFGLMNAYKDKLENKDAA
ncbi:50S ribosomal protein L10 [bacterium]|nr:50S ribosomal protein L10 [bacterium]